MSASALPPSNLSWLILSDSQTLWMTCVQMCVYMERWAGLEEMCSRSIFLTPDLYLFSAQSGDHSFCAWLSFLRSTALNTYCRVWESICLCEALSFLCPCTRCSRTCWETVLYKKHKCYYHLSTCTSTQQPERGQGLCSKKETAPCTKMSLILPQIGPRLRNT